MTKKALVCNIESKSNLASIDFYRDKKLKLDHFYTGKFEYEGCRFKECKVDYKSDDGTFQEDLRVSID